MLQKVISGGQIGADIASLRAAKACGLKTSGMLPKGWKTQDGPRPEYEELYGCIESVSEDYPPRTKWNVENSDGTIRIAESFGTRGELCTLKFLVQAKKPYIDISAFRISSIPSLSHSRECRVREVVQWMLDNNIVIVNIAGNARKNIERNTEEFLKEVFLRVIGIQSLRSQEECHLI